ncbi:MULTISPECIES: TolC family protein [unclassified Sphingomonas]|uniref:TolC family protein n=1 Tax=unclassified Sphingomonas TaxID=196159 RepID=UPI000E712ABF|nr:MULTISPECIES: TolC family protein [unclassified Sphingomonas]RKE53800.1 cobalt-zinc-cadmium efflux system outer membrane protein [Sphingomonas sp. PP-CC-1A-547]TCM10295.1 cobalt-zinc-cadmium efflux system outer membrane protein [Sphingomonas sp. PP-CC-3G-468]
MHRIFAAIVAAGACASSLQAQTRPPVLAEPVLTLADALGRAGAISPFQDAASAGVRAAEAQRRVAALRPNPSIVAETENVAGSGIYRGLRSSETTLGLALPLERGGKRQARMALADAQIGRAGIAAEIARADLRLRVTQAYVVGVAAQRRVAVARDQVGIAAEVLRAAKVRVQAGRASPLEEQRADVARLAAGGALERADRSATVAATNLARLIGMPVGSLDDSWFQLVDALGPLQPSRSTSTLIAAAARADLDTATAQVRLARSQRVPDLTLSASARRLEQTNDTAAVFGVSIPLTVFNGGRSAIAVVDAQRDQSDALRRVALLDAEQDIATTQAEAANAATTARNATGPALTAALEAARIARIGYREGKFGQLDLLDAERTLLDTRTAAIDALAAYHDARARLERLTAEAPIARDTDR